MVRPRWHDARIVVAITALFLVGVWVLWWDDVRGYLDPPSGSPSESGPPPIASGQTRT